MDKNNQIDLIVEDTNDRISRILECKWVDQNNKFQDHLAQLKRVNYTTPDNFLCKKFLLPAYQISKKQEETAFKSDITVLSLNDLFDS